MKVAKESELSKSKNSENTKNNTILSCSQIVLHLSAVQNCVPFGPVPKLAIFGCQPPPGGYFRLWEKLDHLH